ncbi:UNVERIFIED_CONTAM: hypothetical protein GTU68_060124 [Idotea baltica]|nr:hypothetical protein [Idotea baltica]
MMQLFHWVLLSVVVHHILNTYVVNAIRV